MGGLNTTLNTSLQTLLNTQTEIQTASNNISNANTTGYARQVAVQVDNPATPTPFGWLGNGASVTQIKQMRDRFVEQQLMNATSANSQYSSLASQLQSIQASAADTGSTGISQALGSFFDSWDTLAQNPSGLTEQSGVYQAAKNLASAVQSTYNQLDETATTGIPGEIQDTVNQANTLIDQIAELNKAIVQNQALASQPNDLIDARYQAMDSLSQLIPVSFSQDPATGMVTVTTTDASGPVTVVSGISGTHITTSSTISGGQLGGLLQAQTNLSGYIDRLNTFTSSLISQVNTIQTANGGSAVFTGTGASNITASANFLNGQTSAGTNTSAVAIANLQGTQVSFPDGKTATLQEYLSDIQQQMGTDVQQANNNASFNQSLQTELQQQQQSVSGVSLDEEMVNVIQLQQIYEAAAKVISTTSGLLSTIISTVQ